MVVKDLGSQFDIIAYTDLPISPVIGSHLQCRTFDYNDITEVCY